MNQPYNVGRVRLLTAALDWRIADIRVGAWSGVPDFSALDNDVADIEARGHSLLGYSLPITSKTVGVDGTAQTNQVLIPGVPVGQNVTWFTVSEGAVPSAAALILFIDEAIELPFVPNGLDIVVQPDWLANRGWFRP